MYISEKVETQQRNCCLLLSPCHFINYCRPAAIPVPQTRLSFKKYVKGTGLVYSLFSQFVTFNYKISSKSNCTCCRIVFTPNLQQDCHNLLSFQRHFHEQVQSGQLFQHFSPSLSEQGQFSPNLGRVDPKSKFYPKYSKY